MATYITKKPKGYSRSIVVRTDESRQRAANRAVLRSPSFTRVPRSAQDVADEKNLSRSKVYPNKGKREAERRRNKMQPALDRAA